MAAEDGKGLPITDVDAKAASGAADVDLAVVLIGQALRVSWLEAGASESEPGRQARAVLAALKGLAPTSELEGMLATQMVATHNAAMECLRRSMIQGQTFEGRDQNLKHAEKLLGVYTRQVEALDKHRGKGQQKITVEHVTVNNGGQALVGNFDGSAGAPESERLPISSTPAPLAPAMDITTTPARRERMARR